MTDSSPTPIAPKNSGLRKCLTGIKGFDEITEGGIPRNRITLLSGSTGTGKTLLGIDFLINGATTYDEPGVFVSFEENEDELFEDVASLNFDLRSLVADKKILIEYVLLERRDVQSDGEFNLEGLFVRLELAIDAIGATRVVLDSIDSLFAGVTDFGILRLEIKRLFRWLKNKKVTALVTGETTQGTYTGMAWKRTSPIASSSWTIGFANRSPPVACVSSSIAVRTTARMSIRSSSTKAGFRSFPLRRRDSINPEHPSDCRLASRR
jgi:circadian clock protein KaiC